MHAHDYSLSLTFCTELGAFENILKEDELVISNLLFR